MQDPQQYRDDKVEIHAVVWFAGVFFIFVLIAYTVAIHWDSAPTIAHWTWIIIGVLAAIWFIHTILKVVKHHHDSVHDVVIKSSQRKLAVLTVSKAEQKVKQEVAKTAALELLPEMVKYAMDNGYNVKYGGMEVTNYLSNLSSLGSGTNSLLLPSVNEYIPEPHRFSETLRNWQPTKDGILLGTGNEMITTPTGESMCHTALGGKTDSGKSNTELLLMAQLLFLHETVYLCNPHYRRMWTSDNGEVFDVSLMEPHFAYPPLTDPDSILKLIVFLKQELDDRKLRARNQLARFESIYLFMDELPALAYYVPDIMDYLGIFLRESRKYGIFFVGAAQDFLNATLSSDNGAIRENFLTNYYGGGDDTTARVLLDLAKGEKIDQAGLGKKGAFYLLAKSVSHERSKVRVPLVDTQSIEMLFEGRSPQVLSSGVSFDGYIQNQERQNLENLGAKRERIAELKEKGLTQDEIILELWGVRKGGSAKYKSALAEYQDLARPSYN